MDKLPLDKFELFDSHFHIVDNKFPLIPNNGYLPNEFTSNDYLARMKLYDLRGGAIVSGSFQAFNQSYLVDALKKLGPSFVGVTQIPVTVSDDEVIRLNKEIIRNLTYGPLFYSQMLAIL